MFPEKSDKRFVIIQKIIDMDITKKALFVLFLKFWINIKKPKTIVKKRVIIEIAVLKSII